MSGRLLRPRAVGTTHPEASAWRSAVVAAGGSVSSTTLKAVSDFCRSIDAAGIRDRFVRLNLFCGTSDASLIAVRTPLYRGRSSTGTQYSDTIDTNVNFVQGDYAETGSSGGLLGNGVDKRLEASALSSSPIAANDAHLSVYGIDLSAGSGGDVTPIGTRGSNASNTSMLLWTKLSSAQANRGVLGSSTVNIDGSPQSFSGHLMVSATSSTDARFYSSGTQTASVTTSRGTNTLAAGPMLIFASWQNFGLSAYCGARLRAYSYGLGMTAAQASSYYSALQTFQTALGRQA